MSTSPVAQAINMSSQKTVPLATFFDELIETDNENEVTNWTKKVFALKHELATFVSMKRNRDATASYIGYFQGSFNLGLRFTFHNEEPDVLLRFPMPGYTSLRDEKVINEVHVMEYLRQSTTIPIPKVHCWGLTAESPSQLGPFILMDLVSGIRLSSFLELCDDTQNKYQVLNPHIDDDTLDNIYSQIAIYLLQLTKLNLSRIGAIMQEQSTRSWTVCSRPLTYNMNELLSMSGFAADQLPLKPFNTTTEYLEYNTREHLMHLNTQRNLSNNADAVKQRFIARKRFANLIPTYSICDTAPFIPFCDDLRPGNILINPETLQITAIIDLEYTNAMPAQFSYDPPWWLLLSGPEAWVNRGLTQEFIQLYEPRMEQFLRALEKVERASATTNDSADVLLSTRMRDSWTSKRFWFDYGVRKSFELDNIYWAVFHPDSVDGPDSLSDQNKLELDNLCKRKMVELSSYKAECAARFNQ